MKVLSGQTAQTVTESGAGSGDRSLQEKNLSFTLELVCGRAQAPRRPSCARCGWLSGLREPPRDDPDRHRGHERGNKRE